jgi:protein involved in polysaccharide export with SLBB domain
LRDDRGVCSSHGCFVMGWSDVSPVPPRAIGFALCRRPASMPDMRLPSFVLFSFAFSLALLAVTVFGASSARAQGVAPDRALQAGDEVLIVIPERGSTLETTHVIDESGEVALGLYGRVRLAGMDPLDARDALRAHLGAFLRNTGSVYITLLQPQALVFVSGMVESPGLVTVPDGRDAWSAVQAAGGVIEGADLSQVRVLRRQDEIVVDVRAFLTGEEPPYPLRAGDTVFVPASADLPAASSGSRAFLSDEALRGRVFVLGAVTSPGVYDANDGVDVVMVLAGAGGPTTEASIEQARLVTAEGTLSVPLGAIMRGERDSVTVPTQAGSILYIPFRGESASPDMAIGISVLGGANGAGFVETALPLPLTQVIALAGGSSVDANLRRVEHVRQGPTFTVASRYNLRRFFRRGGGASSILVYPGDVLHLDQRERPWETFIGVVSDLALVASAVVVFATFGTQ